MSTTSVSAGQLMDRAANLLNDPNKTDYTYKVMLPYLNLAIEEFCDLLSESNSPFANLTSYHWSAEPILVPKNGPYLLTPEDPTPGMSKYPGDLIEIQEIQERPYSSVPHHPSDPAFGAYRRLPRREFPEPSPPTNSLVWWVWERGIIRFNAASIDMEVVLKYVFQGIPYAADENTIITLIGARTYLSYKTAAFCALFIGENESRAKILETQADEAAERSITISNKGKQEIVTRHRPFRAAYKARGGF